jgi:hypothetical protein
MKRSALLFLLFASLSLPAGLAHAKVDPDKLTVAQTQQLLAISAKLEAVTELTARGTITKDQATAASGYYMDQATKIAGSKVTFEDLATLASQHQVKPEKAKVLQKYQGVLDGVNIWLVVVVVLGAILALIFLSPLLKEIPAGAYELLLYAIGGLMIFAAGSATPVRTPYIALVGVIFVAGGLAMTSGMRLKRWFDEERFFGFPSLALACVSGWTAVHYGSPMIAYVTAISLMLTLLIVIELDDSVFRVTLPAFMVIGTYVCMTAFGWVNPTVEIFRGGMLVMGCLVGYLGLLVGSLRWYGKESSLGYLGMQIVAIVLGAAAITLGPMLGISELTKIGGTFFALYLFVKLFDIPFKSVTGYAGVGALACFLLYQGLIVVKEHPETFAPYLIGM